MFQLRVIQAEHGDCFVLEFGDELAPKYILVDGGPKTTYRNHLKPELEEIQSKGGKLDRVIVSHVDDDHIYGILELLVDLRNQHINSLPKTIEIDSLWLNTFGNTIGHGNNIEYRLERLSQSTGIEPQTYATTNLACYSIKQGHQLRQIFKAHNIPINAESQNKIVSVEDIPDKITNENLAIRVVGPTEENLKKLRKEWLEWLETQKAGKEVENPFFKAMADRSFTNLSSIMVLVEAEGKKILLTGDGRGDHIIQGLNKINALNRKGEMYVDIIKLPHHGSMRNVSRTFFDKIYAHTYIISGNGKHGNPDLTTLKWIVESANHRGDKTTLFATNKTYATEKLINEYPPAQYRYELLVLDRRAKSGFLNLATCGLH